jgi:hypothetical protein
MDSNKKWRIFTRLVKFVVHAIIFGFLVWTVFFQFEALSVGVKIE